MTKLFIAIFASLFLSGVALAQPSGQLTETNSLSKAMLEKMAMHHEPKMNGKVETHYTHESEKHNSLARAVLAIQGVKVNVIVNADSEVDYSRYDHASEQNNSLSRGAMAKK